MSLEVKTYANILDQIEAKFGVESFTSEEQVRIKHLINSRAYEAYQSSSSWPRYLVVGEPRTILRDQTIQRSEDSFFVYGAGNEDTYGLYQRNGTVNGVAAYTKYDTDGTTELFSLVANSTSGTLFLVTGDTTIGLTAIYSGALEGTVTYPSQLTSSEASAGTAPFPFLVDVANINDAIRVHRNRPLVKNSSLEYDFFVTSKGIQILNPFPTDSKIAYVTYKKEFSDFATDATDIPREWFYFITNAVYSDLLRAQYKIEEANTAEALAQNNLSQELEKVNNINNKNITTRFSTHVSRQSR